MEILSKVKFILSRQLGIKEEVIELSSNIEDDLGADSLDIVEIVMSLETEFSVNVDDEEISSLRTIEDIVKFIEKITDKK